jgi:hypothetical protein
VETPWRVQAAGNRMSDETDGIGFPLGSGEEA